MTDSDQIANMFQKIALTLSLEELRFKAEEAQIEVDYYQDRMILWQKRKRLLQKLYEDATSGNMLDESEQKQEE